MGLCGCFASCSCELNIGTPDTLSLTGNGDPLAGGWTLNGIETPLALSQANDGISITLAGPYGHGSAIGLNVDPNGGLDVTTSGAAILIDPSSTAPVSTSAAGLKVDCCGGGGPLPVSGNWGDGQPDYLLCPDTNGAEIYLDGSGELRANVMRAVIDSTEQSAAIGIVTPVIGTRYRTATVTLNALPCQDKYFRIKYVLAADYNAVGLYQYEAYFRVNLGADNLLTSAFMPGTNLAGGQVRSGQFNLYETTAYVNVLPAGTSISWDASFIINETTPAVGNSLNLVSLFNSLHGISV